MDEEAARRDSSYAATSSDVKVMAVGLRRSMMMMGMILGRGANDKLVGSRTRGMDNHK